MMQVGIGHWTVCLFLLVLSGLHAAPTEEREWTSTAGTKVTATALAVADGKVQFKDSNGRTLAVPFDKLVEVDREFLKTHFELDKPATSGSMKASGLAHPLGEIVEGIAADGDSNYHVYLPSSLRAGRKAPLLLFTSAGGGKRNNIELMKEGAEICGWILAASVESSNKGGFSANFEHSKDCVEHILENLPVDPERVYFTGGSGGGATAMGNAARLDHAGVICCIGYIPDDFPKGGYYLFVNGAFDYNRSPSAHYRVQLDEDAFQLYHPGGHKLPPAWIMTDCIVRQNAVWLAKNRKTHADECIDFEASMLTWIGTLKSSEAWRAYAWAHFLLNDYEIESNNKSAVGDLVRELEKNTKNVGYREGLIAPDKFGQDYFAEFGQGSQMNHSTPKITKAAEKLATESSGLPHVEEVARGFAKPTVSAGGPKK